MPARKTILFVSLCASVFGVATAGHLPTIFPLNGSQEFPTVDTMATGQCSATIDPDQTVFSIDCTHDVTDVIAAHIHRGPRGLNGPIVFFFDANTTISGSVSDSSLAAQDADPNTPVLGLDFAQFLDELNRGNLYVNVHSPSNPGGEIRGQITFNIVAFPQVGNGGDAPSISSDIVLTNLSATPAGGVMTFYDRDGLPLNIANGGREVPFDLGPFGTSRFMTDGMGELQVGSALVRSDKPVGGLARFSVSDFGVVGVPVSTRINGGIVPARSEGGIKTGVAIRNASNSVDCVVTFSLRDSDNMEVATAERTLPPRGGVAAFIDELFESFFMGSSGDFQGALIITSDNAFYAIALEQGANPGEFTTLPISPISN